MVADKENTYHKTQKGKPKPKTETQIPKRKHKNQNHKIQNRIIQCKKLKVFLDARNTKQTLKTRK